MDHQVSHSQDHEEAIGAHAGFRIRVVTAWDAAARRFVATAYVRGSETEEEVVVQSSDRHFPLMQDAQDHGFALATRWIDQQVGG